jgi:hypothetical protein
MPDLIMEPTPAAQWQRLVQEAGRTCGTWTWTRTWRVTSSCS